MRTAVISDIHANITALDAVMTDIGGSCVDAIICLGDIATLGPSPREVLGVIRDLKCPCVIGNHEEALFSPNDALKYDIKSNLDSTIQWCLDQLSQDDLTFLRSCVASTTISIGGHKEMLCYHGSPTSSIDGIYPDTSVDRIDSIFATVAKSTQIAIGGHTHVQMLRQHNDLIIANPGSVGCAFKVPLIPKMAPSLLPFAEYAIVDCSMDTISVEFKRIQFNVQSALSIVESSSLPLKDWWIEQYTKFI